MKINEKKLNPELSGIGGWLMFLIISLMFLAPLREVAEYFSIYNKLPEVLKLPIGFLSFSTIFAFVWLGNQLRCVLEWRTIKLAIKVLWILPVTFTFSTALVFYTYTHNVNVFGSIIPQLLSQLIVSGIWTAYLLHSQRVRNTYTSTPLKRDVDSNVIVELKPKLMLFYVLFAIAYWAYWIFAANWWNESGNQVIILTVGFFISLFVASKLFFAGRSYLERGTKINRVASLIFFVTLIITSSVGHLSIDNSNLLIPSLFLILITLAFGLMAFTSFFTSMANWIKGNAQQS